MYAELGGAYACVKIFRNVRHEDVTNRPPKYVKMSLGGIFSFFRNAPLDRSKQGKIINWILLTGKFYIQKRRLFYDGILSLLGFLAETRARLLTERRACSIENKPNKFKIWRGFLAALG